MSSLAVERTLQRTKSRIALPSQLKDLPSLTRHLGVRPKELKYIWWFRYRMYHVFNIQGSRKTRQISAPDERLKGLQRKISLILHQLYSPRITTHGFIKGKSVVTNAKSHLGMKYVVNIDIKDFFGTISERRIIGVLKAIGVPPRVAKALAKICCNNGCLPQGAPSSPVLSNIIMFKFDKLLLRLCKENASIYTRYADDITISSHRPPQFLFESSIPPSGKFATEALSAKIKNIFLGNGFLINEDKLHLSDSNSRKIVTGIKVNQILNVDRKFVRNIRAILFNIEKDGYKSAQAVYQGKFNKLDLERHVRGKISWIANVKGPADPVYRSLVERFNRCFPLGTISIDPDISEIIRRSVWVVEFDSTEDDYSQGTAFFVKGVGLVTAAHCVDKNKAYEIFLPSHPSNRNRVYVKHIDKHRDLALLDHKLQVTEYFELPLSGRDVKVGDKTTALGFPKYGPGDSLGYREGSVSSTPTKSAVKLIEVNYKLSQGMSGGPLLDENSDVVGIIHKGGPLEYRDFAVHVSNLKDWLRELAA